MHLLEDDLSKKTFSAMIQSMNRFLLDRIVSDYKSMKPDSSVADQTLGTIALTSLRCVKCNTETGKTETSLVNDLVYFTKNSKPSHGRGPRATFSQVLKHSIEKENPIKGWCITCRRYLPMATKRSIKTLPRLMMLNAAVESKEAKQIWSTKGWLPEKIGVSADTGHFQCYEGEDLEKRLRNGTHLSIYELVGVVADVTVPGQQSSHLVSLVNSKSQLSEKYDVCSNVFKARRKLIGSAKDSDWHVFNDFLVKAVSKEEGLDFSPPWKTPCIVSYQQVGHGERDDSWKNSLDATLLYVDHLQRYVQFSLLETIFHVVDIQKPRIDQDFSSISSSSDIRTFKTLSAESEAPVKGTRVAIDAEFVLLHQEEIDIKADGSRETVRPNRMGLARVSVLRGSGIDEGLPFIDDYIITTEPVVDYLTAYSGIHAGDLDKGRSKHYLVPLKIAYKKLWLLLNLGCIFVGHGLLKDFRTINIHIPKDQVIDTVDLFYMKSRQRKLSLRFLAWYLLKEDIQSETHDSIEDASTALKLYRKYEEFEDAGIMEMMLNSIYAKGREVNFKVPGSQNPTSGIYRDSPSAPPAILNIQSPGRNIRSTEPRWQ
jgi:PAB-dependent poly(A)-specific ribonuclease subunit 2